MTREAFAVLIYWPYIIWFFGLMNIGAMLPQLIKLWQTRETKGLSLQMIFLVLGVQVAYSLHGFFTRDAMLMWTVGIAANVSIATIISVFVIRRQSQ